MTREAADRSPSAGADSAAVPHQEQVPAVQRISAVLWPSFVLAGIANAVFFTALDPLQLVDYRGEPPLARTTAYSVGFFLFWLLTASSSYATSYFMSTRIPPRKLED